MKDNQIISLKYFDKIDCMSSVFEYCPNTYADKRGGFCQKLTNQCDDSNLWINDLSFIKQINHSYSKKNVFRGFHAQKSPFCQGKLVENMTKTYFIYDIIIDARPNSKTFSTAAIIKLYPYDSLKHNMLWVPRGFLHSFLTPSFYSENDELKEIPDDVDFIFQYYCDNTYSKKDEIGIKPSSVFSEIINPCKDIYPDIIKSMSNDFVFSEKDENGLEYSNFMQEIKHEYDESGKMWF